MNRLNFWSRSSSKSRTAEAKAEVEASEQKDDRDKKSKKHTRVEAKKDEPLEVVAPQEDVVKETAKDRAGEEEQPELQAIAPKETTEATLAEDDKVDDEEKPTEDVPTAVATKDEHETAQGIGMPGGASTSAPHTDEDNTNDKKEEDSEQMPGGASKAASHKKEEQSAAKDTTVEDVGAESLPAGALTTAPHAEQESEEKVTTEKKQEVDNPTEDAQISNDYEDTASVDPASIQLPMKEEDEEFFNKMTTEDEPQQPPSMSRRPTEIGDNGELHEPEDIPLPMSPGNEEGNPLDAKKDQTPTTWKDRWNQWSFVPAAPSTSYFRRAPKEAKKTDDKTDDKSAANSAEKQEDNKTETEPTEKTDEKTSPTDAEAIANAAKATDLTAEDTKSSTTDTKKAEAQQHRDLSHMLSNLKLSSLNNSVMGISHETQHLLESFTLVLKDVVNGAPTAYEDLDKLLTERGEQLDNLFSVMPPFVQTLVKSLPVKMYGAMAPSVAAAMSSEKADNVDLHAAEAGTDDEAEVTIDLGSSEANSSKEKKKKRGLVPSVQSLVKEQGTVAAMLRSILNFLQARFPMFITGTNVLMSVSVFLLLFVFWYCHKRGKQVRLSKQAANKIAAEASLDDLEKQVGGEEKERMRVEELPEEAVDVPLPEVNDAELKEGSSTDEAQNDAEEANIVNDTDATTTKEANPTPASESFEDQKKDINQTLAETFLGAKPSSSSTSSTETEKTKADQETQDKLAALQQKAVDEAPAAHSAPTNNTDTEDNNDDDEEVTEAAEFEPTKTTIPNPPIAAEAKDSAAPSPVEEKEKGKSDAVPASARTKEPQAQKQHTFDDLLKALETHAKESGSGKNDTAKAKEYVSKTTKKEQEEIVDDPNEEMMAY